MLQYKPAKDALYFDEKEMPSLTEQEHKDSCDINLMIQNAHRGLQVRGGASQQYGYDDMNMDRLALNIQRADLEEKLLKGVKEFTQEELDLFPKEIQHKFGYKLKKTAETPKATNDDQTTNQPKQSAPTEPKPADPKQKPDS